MTTNPAPGAPWPIRQWGDPVLRTPAAPFDPQQMASAATQDLIETMIATLRAAGGIGLAAPQIGVAQRLIVVEIPPLVRLGYGAVPATPLTVLLNPELVETGPATRWAPEACLSINASGGGRYEGIITRPDWVRVRGYDRAGHEITVVGDRLLARALQHEIDHLDGILFVDRIQDPRDLRIVYPVAADDPVRAGARPLPAPGG